MPRLRSLTLTQDDTQQRPSHLPANGSLFDFKSVLDSLPCLTALRCADGCVGMSDLLDFASHSQLERLNIEARCRQMADSPWLGAEMVYPVDVGADEWQLEHVAVGGELLQDKAHDSVRRGSLKAESPYIKRLGIQRTITLRPTTEAASESAVHTLLYVTIWLGL